MFLSTAVADDYRFWALGDVGGRYMNVVYATAPFIFVGLAITLTMGRALNALSLGEDVARSLGQRVVLTRIAAVLAVILLAGGSVAAAGPIAFVGLAVRTLSAASSETTTDGSCRSRLSPGLPLCSAPTSSRG